MKLITGFAWITFGRMLAAVLQALSLILVARYAGPANFGVLAAFIGLVIVFQAFFDFGISTYITKQRAKSSDDPQVVEAIYIYQYLGAALLMSLSMAALILSYIEQYAWWLFLPLAIAGCLERQSDVRLTIALADGDVWKNATNLVVRRAIALAVLLAVVQVGLDALQAYGIAAVMSSFVSYVVSRRFVKIDGHPGGLSWTKSKAILVASRPFWANSLGAQLRNLDVLLVNHVATASIAGYYGAVSRSVSPLRMVSSSLATVMLPMVARRNGRVRSFLWAVAVVIGSLSAGYASLAVFAEQAVLFLLGAEYLPAVVAFKIVIVGLVFASVSSVMTSILQASGWEKSVGKISLATSFLALAGVAVGVTLFEATGAAFGLSVSYIVQCAALTFTIMCSRKTRKEE